MKKNEMMSVESYFKTKNEHWNRYAKEAIEKALEKQLFEDYNKFMSLYSESITIATDTHKAMPFEGFQLILSKYESSALTTEQKIHLLKSVFKYLRNSEFDNDYSWEIEDFIQSQLNSLNEIMKIESPKHDKPLTNNLRNTLKELIQNEMAQLPETLKQLDTKERLNVMCKLMPYVLPRTESVKHTFGEPQPVKKNWWEI